MDVIRLRDAMPSSSLESLQIEAEESSGDDMAAMAAPIKFQVNVEVEAFDENTAIKKIKVEPTFKLAITQCEIMEDSVFAELDRLANTQLSVVDQTLLVAARNNWGGISCKPHCETKQQNKFQLAINNWRSWASLSNMRGTPLMYKCYICTKAWWRLHPFAEHVKIHQEDNFSCYIETQFQECNLIACLGDKHALVDIPIETDCWKCGNDYAFHIETAETVKRVGKSYKCEYCCEKLFTCTAITSHYGYCSAYKKVLSTNYSNNSNVKLFVCHICKLRLTDRDIMQKHYKNFHDVQSDLPTLVPVNVCQYCNQYVVNKFHQCSHKKLNQLCPKCQKRFPSVLVKKIHSSINRGTTYCSVCKQSLPGKCMEANHLVTHSRNFNLLYKCVQCEGNLFFMCPVSMKHHNELSYHKEKRKHYSEAVVLPSRCISPNMVDNKSSVVFDDVTFEIITKSHRRIESTSDTLNTITNEQENKMEIFIHNSKSESSNKISAILKEDSTSEKENSKDNNTNDNNKLQEVHGVLNEIDQITVINIGDVHCKQEKVTNECSQAAAENTKKINKTIKILYKNTEKLDKNTEKLDENTKNHFKITSQHSKITIANTECASNSVKIKIEPNDDLEVFDDHNYALDVKQEVDFECTNTYVNLPVKEESMSYEDVLSKVFGGSQHFATTTATIIKEEPIDEEIFEDDIILLTDNNTFGTTDVKQEIADEVSLVYSEGNIDVEIEDFDNNKKTNESSEDVHVDSESDQSVVDYEFVSRYKKAERSVEASPQPSTSKSRRSARRRKCDRCGFVGSSSKSYVQHTSYCVHPYRCTKCDQNFKSLKAYVWHFQKHGYVVNSCPECDMAYSFTANLVTHMKMHIKNSYRKQNVLLNKRKMDVSINYICITCNEVVDVELLFEHWEGHIELSPGIIDNIEVKEEADDREAFAGSLSRDVISDIKKTLLLKKDHFMNMQKVCYVCDRNFKRKNDFKRHLIEHLLTDAMSRHAAYNAMKCHFCDHTTNKSFSFRLHMRDHAGLPVYRCGLCRKSFSDSSNFAKHKKVHNYASTLQCDICKKKFHSKVMLIKHIQMHESTKPVVCKCCGKTFYEPSAYRRHQRNVDSSKTNRFPCKICKHSFSCIKDNWDHMWEIHKQRKHHADCPICHKPFRKYIDVKKHIKSDHNKDVSLLKASIFKSMFGSEIRKGVKISGNEEPDEMFVVFEND